MFDQLAVRKSADIHHIEGHWFARTRIEAGGLTTRPNCIACFDAGLDREFQVLDAFACRGDLPLQDLRALKIGFRQVLVFDQRLRANVVRNTKVSSRKTALNDGFELFQICRHLPRSAALACVRDCRIAGEAACIFWSLAGRKGVLPVTDKAAWPQSRKAVAFADELCLIEITEFVYNICPGPAGVFAMSKESLIEADRPRE